MQNQIVYIASSHNPNNIIPMNKILNETNFFINPSMILMKNEKMKKKK